MADRITTEYKQKLEELMDGYYKYVPFFNRHYIGEKMYLLDNGNVFHIDIISSGRLCIEYADSREDADRLTLEDGDSFYIEDHKDVEAMLKHMLEEIAQRDTAE